MLTKKKIGIRILVLALCAFLACSLLLQNTDRAVAADTDSDVTEASLIAYWQDNDESSTLAKMTWRQSYGAYVAAQFPTGATNKKVIIKPESAGMQLLNNLSDNEAVKSGATVSTGSDASTTSEFGKEAFADATTTYTLNSSTDNLKLNGILFGSSAFYSGNTGRPLLVSTLRLQAMIALLQITRW